MHYSVGGGFRQGRRIHAVILPFHLQYRLLNLIFCRHPVDKTCCVPFATCFPGRKLGVTRSAGGGRVEGQRQRISSAELHSELIAGCGAGSHDPEIII